MPKKKISSDKLSSLIIQGMQDKKAFEISRIDLTVTHNAVADYFIVCSGNSDTHLDAIANSIEEVVLKEAQQKPWQKEGKMNKEWILLDYIDVVAHIFIKDKRAHYSLEELWGDAPVINFSNE